MTPTRTTFGLAAALLLAPAAARAQSSAMDSIVRRCVTIDTAAEWLRVAAAFSDGPDSHWSNDSLRRVLLALAQGDQAVRAFPGVGDSMANPAFARRMAVRDSADAAALQQIIDRFGWPTRSLVGAQGAEAAFLIAQHNPPLFHEVLALMRALPPAEFAMKDFAMLEDRMRVADGLPQRYGSQGSVRDGVYRFAPIEDTTHLDQRRAAAGLPPLDAYLCLMRGYSGHPVEDPRTGKH